MFSVELAVVGVDHGSNAAGVMASPGLGSVVLLKGVHCDVIAQAGAMSVAEPTNTAEMS